MHRHMLDKGIFGEIYEKYVPIIIYNATKDMEFDFPPSTATYYITGYEVHVDDGRGTLEYPQAQMDDYFYCMVSTVYYFSICSPSCFL